MPVTPIKVLKIPLIVLLVSAVVTVGSDLLTSYVLESKIAVGDGASRVTEQPYVHNGDGVAMTTLVAGRTFFIHNVLERSRTCHLKYSTAILSEGPERFSYVFPGVETWSMPGHLMFNELTQLPSTLPPGNYTIVRKQIHFCGREVYYTYAFKIPVTVVAAH